MDVIEFIHEWSHEIIEEWFEAQRDMMDQKMEHWGENFEHWIS